MDDQKRGERDARVLALPQVFQDRIVRFQRFRGEGWRVAFESYEVFVCEEAVKIATAFDEPELIAAFNDADYKTQREYLPELSGGHSNNSFAVTVGLAMVYIMTPELVVKCHGARHEPIGCEVYGCWAAEAATA